MSLIFAYPQTTPLLSSFSEHNFHLRTTSFHISGVVSPIINLFVSSFLNPSSTSYFLYLIFGWPSTIVIWTSDKDCWHPPDISCLVLLFASFIHYHWIMTCILRRVVDEWLGTEYLVSKDMGFIPTHTSPPLPGINPVQKCTRVYNRLKGCTRLTTGSLMYLGIHPVKKCTSRR